MLTSSDESLPFRLEVLPMVDYVAEPAAKKGLFMLAFDWYRLPVSSSAFDWV